MPAVITARDVEDLIAQGGDPKSLPSDAILTPSAKDVLREIANRRPSPSAKASA